MITIRHFFDLPPSTDPDNDRRRKLVNILLVALGVLSLAGLLVTIAVDVTNAPIARPGAETESLVFTLYVSSIGTLMGIFVILFINRYWSGWLASSILLLFLIVILAFSDEPIEVIGGRSLLFFAIPIVMASVILPAYGSFIATFAIGLLLAMIALNANLVPNMVGTIGLFFLAVISWLSARSLEQALDDLKQINANLDKLVEARTQELANALAREIGLAGRNQAILES